MRRIAKAALGGLAGCALMIGAAQAANGESAVDYYYSSDKIVDLQPGTTSPLDGPEGEPPEVKLRIKQAPEATNFKLTVSGILPSAEGHDYGAHLHVGACAPTNLDNPGPHYRNVFEDGATPENEVWLDLVPNASGDATDSTTVPFIPADNDGSPGLMSIVIHEGPAAVKSDKLACFDLAVSKGPEWTDLLEAI